MKEDDIRKREIFNRYLEMVKIDVENLFNDFSSFNLTPCPACQSQEYSVQFNKVGFDYVLCRDCGTLFVNPRPSFEVLDNFYTQSSSTKFWVDEFFKPIAEVRRIKMFRPRAEYTAQKFGGKSQWIIGDIGAGFGLFLEELSKIWPLAELVAIEPSKEMSKICINKGFEVVPCAVERMIGWDKKFDLLTSFELFEHIYNPAAFLKKVRELLRSDGIFLFTTLNGEGFDIQVLRHQSKSVFPPHHLNFFNPQSVTILLERCGFVVDEISTPGKLDWDIVEGMINVEDAEVEGFWKLLAEKGSTSCKEELQKWISKHSLSSHMRIVAKKQY